MFSRNGLDYHVVPDASSVLDKLPPAIYQVNQNPITGAFYLSLVNNSFPLPTKIFNFNNIDVSSDLDQLFIERYEKETGNLGVLLTGIKGTGKSLLLKKTANQAILKGYPIILVENSFDSSALASFLSSIKQSTAILFDEFEKRYSDRSDRDNSQEGLLSLFDGTSATHNLFILTANDSAKVNPFFINRPSRIRYVIDYTALTKEFIEQYLKDYLTDKSIIGNVLNEILEIDDINFDILKTVADEINIMSPKESVKTIFKILNVATCNDTYIYCDAQVFVDEQPIGKIFTQVDFEDVEGYGSHISLGSIRHQLQDGKLGNLPMKDIRLTKSNSASISGRNHFTLTDTILDEEGKEHKLFIEFKRIRITKGF